MSLVLASDFLSRGRDFHALIECPILSKSLNAFIKDCKSLSFKAINNIRFRIQVDQVNDGLICNIECYEKDYPEITEIRRVLLGLKYVLAVNVRNYGPVPVCLILRKRGMA